MTSSTQDAITGYFPRALIWIDLTLVRLSHTCKTVHITYKYVIIIIIIIIIIIMIIIIIIIILIIIIIAIIIIGFIHNRNT